MRCRTFFEAGMAKTCGSVVLTGAIVQFWRPSAAARSAAKQKGDAEANRGDPATEGRLSHSGGEEPRRLSGTIARKISGRRVRTHLASGARFPSRRAAIGGDEWSIKLIVESFVRSLSRDDAVAFSASFKTRKGKKALRESWPKIVDAYFYALCSPKR